MPQHLSTMEPDFEARFTTLLNSKREDSVDVDDAVAAIIADVRARGDAALIDHTLRFDRLDLRDRPIRVSEVEIDAALSARQPEDQWLARADWRAGDYRARLRGA